jgi:hypothetical protein
VTAKNKVGGLVGDNTWGSYGGYIKNCYSTGHVTGSGGGLVGYNYQGGVTYDSYWDKETSGKTSSHGGAGRNTSQMMQQATFMGWDFDEVWGIVEGQTYPFLLWELSGVELAIARVEGAIGQKAAVLEALDAALEQEDEVCAVLEEVLESGDMGDLKKGDVIKAQQKIHTAIQHQEQSADSLDKGIEKLYDALMSLGWEPEPEPNEPNLIANWKFDEGSGTTAYDSAGSNHGTLTNGPAWTSGQIGGGLDFDGSNDYVEVLDPGNGSLDFGVGNFSISLWFKTTDSAGELVDKSGGGGGRSVGYSLYTGSVEVGAGEYRIDPGILSLRVREMPSGNRDQICTVNTYNDGLWHHLVATRAGTSSANLDIYVDGVDVPTINMADQGAGDISNSYGLSVGAKYDAGDSDRWEDFFDGLIDDVRIYDKALSAEEVQQLYQNGL